MDEGPEKLSEFLHCSAIYGNVTWGPEPGSRIQNVFSSIPGNCFPIDYMHKSVDSQGWVRGVFEY